MAKRRTASRKAKRRTKPIRRKALKRSATRSTKSRPGRSNRSRSKPKARTRTKTRTKAPGAAKPASRKPRPATSPAGAHRHATSLDRPRRTLTEIVPSPPSSLNLDRHPSAARSGRDAAEQKASRGGIAPAITAGDADVSLEDAYFSGDEAPGGDNPTPDQDIVDDIGKALGVEYQDAEELRGADKLTDRDKHRWELDPASSEDYKDRKQ